MKALQKKVRPLQPPQDAGACAVAAPIQAAGGGEVKHTQERPEDDMKIKNSIGLWNGSIMFGTAARRKVTDRHGTKSQAEAKIMKVNN